MAKNMTFDPLGSQGHALWPLGVT